MTQSKTKQLRDAHKDVLGNLNHVLELQDMIGVPEDQRGAVQSIIENYTKMVNIPERGDWVFTFAAHHLIGVTHVVKMNNMTRGEANIFMNHKQGTAWKEQITFTEWKSAGGWERVWASFSRRDLPEEYRDKTALQTTVQPAPKQPLITRLEDAVTVVLLYTRQSSLEEAPWTCELLNVFASHRDAEEAVGIWYNRENSTDDYSTDLWECDNEDGIPEYSLHVNDRSYFTMFVCEVTFGGAAKNDHTDS